MTMMGNTNFMSTGNRPGYVLVGWKIQGGDEKIYNVINGSNIAFVENIMMYTPVEDTTFIAQWTENI